MLEMSNRTIDSMFFIMAALALGIVTFLAFAFAAKEKTLKRNPQNARPLAFLANRKRALVYYNLLSLVYDVLNPHIYTSSARDEVAKMVDVGKQLQVLDVGCGTGYTTLGVLSVFNVGQVIGIDQNLRQLHRAVRNLSAHKSRTIFSQGDVESLPFRDGIFDAVISAGAVEYFPDPEKALKEMVRVAKPQGRVIIAGPNYEWFGKLHLDRVFYTPSTQDLEIMLRRARLREVKTVLRGPNTLFDTDKYIIVAVGTKTTTTRLNYELSDQIVADSWKKKRCGMTEQDQYSIA
jgi:MPBQ/MSBQ methyltransferase